MLTRKDFLSLNFVKKEDFTGSHKGMRFMLHLDLDGDQKRLKVYLWSEPYGFDATPEEQKKAEYFDFSEEGLEQAILWMNENYEVIKYKESEN